MTTATVTTFTVGQTEIQAIVAEIDRRIDGDLCDFWTLKEVRTLRADALNWSTWLTENRAISLDLVTESFTADQLAVLARAIEGPSPYIDCDPGCHYCGGQGCPSYL